MATVHVYHGDSVKVDVYNYGEKNPDAENTPFQQGRASGYGYDRETAALSGLTIDGHELCDHCGAYKKPPKGLDYFPEDYKAPKGYELANWLRRARYVENLGYVDDETKPRGWGSCFKRSGLSYLEALGYRVIRAI